MIAIYKKIDDFIKKITEGFCAILLAAIIIICFTNTVSRYIFSYTFVWAEEIVKFMAVWLTIVGASLTARIDGHTTLDILQESVKNPKVRTILYVITRTLAVLSMVLLFPYGITMVQKMGAGTSASTGLPMWVLYSAYPVGTATIILAYIRIVPERVKKMWKGE